MKSAERHVSDLIKEWREEMPTVRIHLSQTPWMDASSTPGAGAIFLVAISVAALALALLAVVAS